jgi:hypothetical protein
MEFESLKFVQLPVPLKAGNVGYPAGELDVVETVELVVVVPVESSLVRTTATKTTRKSWPPLASSERGAYNLTRSN